MLHTINKHRIRGGIDLPRFKPGLEQAPVDIAIPDTLIYPLAGYRGSLQPARVAVGDTVRVGQEIAEGIVASAKGVVRAIEEHAFAHPSGESVPSVVIDTQAQNRSETCWHDEPLTLDNLRRSGIIGHGGAGFATHDKLRAVGDGCDYLLINAAECEPGIACDEALLMFDIQPVLDGIHAVIKLLQPSKTLIAIESDKTLALEKLETALQQTPSMPVTSMPIEARYPSGAERVLVNLLLRQHGHPRLRSAELPSDRATLCLNLATVHAIGRFAQGRFASQRLVTVNGPKPCHARVTFGTPIRDVLESTGNRVSSNTCVRIGGPLSGYELQDLDSPVTAIVNAINVVERNSAPSELPCIRCGDCQTVCPAGLYPQQLHASAKAKDPAGLDRQGLEQCITCGCCDLVCPSSIRLTASFRDAQHLRWQTHTQDQAAARAAHLYARRQHRLQRDSERQIPEATPSAGNAVAAALARAKSRRKPRS